MSSSTFYTFFSDNMAQKLPNESGDNLVKIDLNEKEGVIKHLLKVIASLLGVGLKSEYLKCIDSINFFSFTYYTDHKNGFGCLKLVNLNKSRPDTFLILFLPKTK